MTRASLFRVSALLMLAALVAVAGIFAQDAPPASAQSSDHELWSATLTAKQNQDPFSGAITGRGCFSTGSTACNASGALSESGQFAFDSETLLIRRLELSLDETEFTLGFDTRPTDAARTALVLQIGNRKFPLANAIGQEGTGTYEFKWEYPGLTWTDNQQIQVSFFIPAPSETESNLPQSGTAIWEAKLTMRDLNDDNTRLGCTTNTSFAAGDRCDDTATITQNTFNFAGAPGRSGSDDDARLSRLLGAVVVTGLYTLSDGTNTPRKLVLTLDQEIPESLRNSATLVFDESEFQLRDGVLSDDRDIITWHNSGFATNHHADDQVVQVGLYLNRVGPSVTEWQCHPDIFQCSTRVGPSATKWQPTMKARHINNSHAKAGCGGDIDCGAPVVFGGNRFSVNAPKYGGLRSYSIKELSVEFVARYGHDEVHRRVTLTVDEGGGTVDLDGASLELTANRQSIRLPIRTRDRIGPGTWTWVESGSALAWGDYSTVGVRIIPVTTGLQTVRVYYDGMVNGQAVDGFTRWDIAREKPYASDDWDGDRALVAVIPGEFVSINTKEKVTTTHAKLLLRGDWPGSRVQFYHDAPEQWNAPPNELFYRVDRQSHESYVISLNAEKSNTYVWVRVYNGDRVQYHLVIIDPPPRTYKVNPEASVTEGEEATVTVSLGSPATKGGVSFNVTTEYGDGGATADDVGEIVSTVTVPEGQQSASIAVPTVDDEAIEDDESFTVTVEHVGEPLWAVEPGKTGTTTITIENDDKLPPPPPGPEPWNIQVTPGDGQLTVTWNVSSREGYEDSEIWHALRWFQPYGGPHRWDNPRDPRAVGKNDGLSVDPGVTTYTITGLVNGVATDVFVRSMVGHRNNMSERSGDSSRWVKAGGDTTPVAPPNEAPTVTSGIPDATIVNTSDTHQATLLGVFDDADQDSLTVTASSSNQSVATVSVSTDYSTLTVTALARGTAAITVTADDGAATVEDTFTITVKAAPVLASAIADVSGLEVDGIQAVSLSGVISDADGDSLTITASSSNDAVATVSVATDYSGLTVSGKIQGTATITVTAQDSDGNSVSDAFDVTVVAAQPVNNAPTVSSAIGDATIVNESGTSQVSLSGVFTDADSDSLTITASSSNEAVATASVSADQATLTVTAKARGTATVTVTAKDGNGGSVEDSFTVTVKAAPVVASAIGDVSELEIGATHEVSMSGVFSDADGDGLTFSATSSDSTVVQVSNTIDPSTGSATAITVIGVDAGTATITVAAQDSDGNSVSDAFDVTVPATEQQQAVELPGPVSGLTVTAAAENGVTVSWNSPETGGAPHGYIAHIKPEGGKQGSGTTKRPGADSTTVTFKNLESGRTYEVWVRAQNDAGKGERTNATITLAGAPREAEEIPGPVIDLQLSATSDSVTVSWSAPETGGVPDNYIVHIKPEDGGKGRTKTPKAKKNTVTFNNLEAGRTYEVWVRAENGAGKGERIHASITLPQAEPPQEESQGDGQQ